MKQAIFFVAFLICAISYGQKKPKIKYIGYVDNAYFEIVQRKNSVTAIKYSLINLRLKCDSIAYMSIEEVKENYNFSLFLKSKSLQKEASFLRKEFPRSSINELNFVRTGNSQIKGPQRRLRRLDFQTKTDTLYSFHFYKNGEKSLWYLLGDASLDRYNRFWCKPKKQPVFIPIRNLDFDVILVNNDGKLSLLYFDKKKGLLGYVFF